MKRLALAIALVAAPLVAVPSPSVAAEPVGIVRAYEVEPVGGLPSGCTTPAGKGAAVVSSERGAQGVSALSS